MSDQTTDPSEIDPAEATDRPLMDPAEAERRRSGRILVFVVAYKHERHLVSVFERVPDELFRNDHVHFLVIDDASEDAGPDLLRAWTEGRGIENVMITRNPVNQNYGGNQKLGYRQAVDAGYDFTILLHGDGQYAPELLPKFIETWYETGADVVLGTRMGSIKSARAGGMPLYKIVGNRMLTVMQNALTGHALSEYHTGFRAYSSNFLRKVPFEINTNDFHFDTEILLQAMHVDAKIEEFDIPTRYGDEDCNVDGMSYARNVTKETLRYRLHRMGMLCSLKYRNLEEPEWRTGGEAHAKPVYSAHRMVFDVIRRAAPERVLDLGCGHAVLASACRELGIEVTGVDRREPEAGRLSRFLKSDLDEPLPVDAFEYDLVLLVDVIEELEDPERFLLSLRNRSRALEPGGKGPLVVLATPNVAFISNRLALLFGRFNYTDRGLLDVAHKRLLNRVSLRRMLRDCGYEIEEITPVPVPWAAVLPGRFGEALERASGVLARMWGSLFGFQFVVTCRPLPGVEHVLGERERLPHAFASD